MLERSSTHDTDIPTFRDYLRTKPNAAAEYTFLKRLVATRPESHRGHHQQAKPPFVQRILILPRNSLRPSQASFSAIRLTMCARVDNKRLA